MASVLLINLPDSDLSAADASARAGFEKSDASTQRHELTPAKSHGANLHAQGVWHKGARAPLGDAKNTDRAPFL